MIIVYGIRLRGEVKYVGVTDRLNRRWGRHQSRARTGSSLKLNRAMIKEGFDAFDVVVIERHKCREDAMSAEVRLIAELGTYWENGGYNLTSGGDGCPSLAEPSRASRRKAWDCPKKREKMLKNLSSEKRAINARKAVSKMVKTDEWKARTREGSAKRSKNKTWIKNTSEANRLKAKCPEWLKKVSDSAKRRASTPEGRERIKSMVVARDRDPDVRKRRSEAAKRRAASPEGRAQIMAMVATRKAKQAAAAAIGGPNA